ncbi:3D domain-containing protein [Paenibacillus koleovorans]|uniref:3D domain-containing protein n=1 Tax=Paenibacillus koleovorans TaxID=121608 RepID=UPI000FD760F7|nr:3D domain-containing protein [Paenibacillus koleovorans]
MGSIHQGEPHVQRSSSMTFALRWKRENLRLITGVAVFATAMCLMFLVLLHGTATKSISVVIDGQETVVSTKQWVLQDLLHELALDVKPHDRLSLPLDAKLQNGDSVVIDRAIPFQLTADGKTETYYTIARTVAAALEDLNVPVGELDKVSPALGSSLFRHDPIQIVRVMKTLEDQTESIPFDTVQQNDANLLKGKEQVVAEGREGILAKKIEKVYEDGVLVSENVVDMKVAEESVNRVVALGTKNPVVVLSASSPNIDEVTKSGVTFAYKQILNNVSLTAYSIDASSTGKSPDHPAYGLTYSGTRVTEGRTIAVDPKVIPIGWWVYIEGIGLRRAEDIGSGVKGNLIDIYFENLDYAKRFGMKRGYKVYIIGKDKPATN